MPARPPVKEITRWSTKRESGRDMAVTLVAIHESVGITDAWDLALFCERRGVSYHDITDLSTMVHTVRFTDTAWHLRDGCDASVGLCLTTPTRGYSRDEWLGPQRAKVEIAAWWVARSCKIYGLPIRHCNHAQIRSALRGVKADGGVITHNDYTLATRDGTHTDPRNFPMDVCLDMARGITDVPEDDMAQVPQAEWADLLNKVRTMYGDRDPKDRHTMRRVDGGYLRKQIPPEVWDHLIENYVGTDVAARQILVAIEKRLNDQGLAILELLKRTGGIPDQWKSLAEE